MELLIKLARGGCTIAHAPVRAVYHDGQARSKMHPVRDTVRICLWSLAFRYLGPDMGLPLPRLLLGLFLRCAWAPRRATC